MVGKVIYNLLTTSTELTALISDKVFPLISEDETIINYIVYERRSTQPTNTKLKRSTVDVISYDIMIFTDGLEIMNDIALGVRNALDQYKGVNSGLWIDNIVYTGENDEYEPESNVFGKFMSFDVRFNNIYSTLKQPTNLTTTATSTEITLNWDDNATGETGYKVYRSTNLRDYELITSLGSGIENYEDTDVVIDTVYYYFIVAYNSVGNGYASDVVADKLGGGTAPDGEFYINLVKVADVPSGGNASAFVTLDGVNAGTYNSINNTWEVVSDPCADATYTIKDRDETTLYSGSIVSGGNLNQYIENTTVEVNDTSFADVVAQGYLNVPILNEDGGAVGTITGTDVIIANSDISINGTLVQSVLSEDSQNINVFNSNNENVGSENTGNWEVGDSSITVNGNAYNTIKAEGTLDVAVHNTESTQLGSDNGGIWEIQDTTYNIYVNGVLNQSFSVPTLKNETINITP